MLRLLAVVAALLVFAPQAAQAQYIVMVPALPAPTAKDTLSKKVGPDAGWLALSTAGVDVVMNWTGPGAPYLQYAYRQQDGTDTGYIWAESNNMFKKKEFQDSEWPVQSVPAKFKESGLSYAKHKFAGTVAVQKIPPGKYVLSSIQVQGGGATQTIGPLTIPFEIKPNATTYLGEFRAYELERKSIWALGMKATQGWNVVVTDRRERDLPLIRQKEPSAGEIEAQVADVANQGQTFLNATP